MVKKNGRRVFLGVAIFVVSLAIALIMTLAQPIPAIAAATNWGYKGAIDQTRWGKLSPDFAKCDLGKKQSPINITRVVNGTPAQISFDYHPTPLTIFNNGHTIQVNDAASSKVKINGNEYKLLQFHFHTPSEHKIGGKAAAMELHLVHRNSAGKLAVIAVEIETGLANPIIDQIWEHIPATGETNLISDRAINAIDLLPKSKAYFSYDGSLTTPPCSEDVKWNVLVEPITASAEAIDLFQKLYPADARSVQPINGRLITLHRER
jgi:carbonic anhydrase